MDRVLIVKCLIISSPGVVKLLQSVDRETLGNYTMVIHATDSAPHPFQLQSIHTVTFTLLDINDNRPVFGYDSRLFVVRETQVY